MLTFKKRNLNLILKSLQILSFVGHRWPRPNLWSWSFSSVFTEEKMFIKDDHISKEAVCSLWRAPRSAYESNDQFMSNAEGHHHVHHLSFSNLRLFHAHTAKHGSPGHHMMLPPCGVYFPAGEDLIFLVLSHFLKTCLLTIRQCCGLHIYIFLPHFQEETHIPCGVVSWRASDMKTWQNKRAELPAVVARHK